MMASVFNIKQYLLINFNWGIKFEDYCVTGIRNESPEESFPHVSSVQAVTLINLNGCPHLCIWVDVCTMKWSFPKVFILAEKLQVRERD